MTLPARNLFLRQSSDSLILSIITLSSTRGLFVLWGGWGERKRERAGHDGKGGKRREISRISPLPIVHRAFSIFFIIAIFIAGYPEGASAEERAIIKQQVLSCCQNLQVLLPITISRYADDNIFSLRPFPLN